MAPGEEYNVRNDTCRCEGHVDNGGTRNLRANRTFEGRTLAGRSQPPSEAQYRALVEGEKKFSERYADVALLGEGGMGEVRLCLDLRTEREVAVKRIDKGRRALPQRERFLREARIQAQLDHPAIVPVYDIGIDDEGVEYFTMKRAVGSTLEEIIEKVRAADAAFRDRYTLTARLGIFRQVLQAVEYAHSRGIVHRDLKPANVIVGELGETYVLDWGIAKVTRGDEQALRVRTFRTGGDTALGTPGYLAPEQSYDAEAVDGRADVYALGAILFELLTLDPLHEGDDIEVLLDSTRSGRADARISVRKPGLAVPPELERACVLATKTSPDERISVAELHAIVGGYLDGDRDLALRRELAQRHADAAARAYAVLPENEDPDGKLRAEALQQAGHALALDPQSRTAIDVITQLMARPPGTMPPEAAAMLRKEERTSERAALRWSVWVYAAFVPLLLVGFSIVRVNNWFAVAAMTVPLLVAIGLSVLGTLARPLRPPPLLVLGAVLVSISASSCLSSPYVIMPALLTAIGTAAIGTARPAIRRPLLWSAMCLVAAVVPMVLQALDLLPVTFAMEDNRMLIEFEIASASRAVRHGALVAATLMTIFAPMVFTYQTARQLRETRARLLLHVWHLRQLTSA
jgi:serine/threonine-protein kinase